MIGPAFRPAPSLGHYDVTALIGEGGMGEVYRARDTKLDRDVAFKVLPEAFTQDLDRLARFEREAKVLASLNHPGITQLARVKVRVKDTSPFISCGRRMLMTSRYACLIAVAIAITGCSVPICAQQPEVDGANAVLPWAFVLNDPASGSAAVPDPDEVVTVPGSSVSMPRSAINIDNGPPDWHPDGHPPMPELVATGGGEGVVACGYCHLPNGQGKPENASLAEQPYEYIVQQMADWRNGLRKTGEPRMGPPSFMVRIGLAATDEQARVAAEYFSSIDFKPWVRVVETDMVPETRFAGWIHKVNRRRRNGADRHARGRDA